MTADARPNTDGCTELSCAQHGPANRQKVKRCPHGMVAAWCQDCIEAEARAYGCGVER